MNDIPNIITNIFTNIESKTLLPLLQFSWMNFIHFHKINIFIHHRPFLSIICTPNLRYDFAPYLVCFNFIFVFSNVIKINLFKLLSYILCVLVFYFHVLCFDLNLGPFLL